MPGSKTKGDVMYEKKMLLADPLAEVRAGRSPVDALPFPKGTSPYDKFAQEWRLGVCEEAERRGLRVTVPYERSLIPGWRIATGPATLRDAEGKVMAEGWDGAAAWMEAADLSTVTAEGGGGSGRTRV